MEQVKFQMKFVYIGERKNGSVCKIVRFVRSIVKIWIYVCVYVYIYVRAQEDATRIFRRIYPREGEGERALSEIESRKLN